MCKWIGCFVRFGSFEIFKTTDSETGRTGPSVGRNDILKQMLDYTVQTFYPEVDISNRRIICILTLVFDTNIIVFGGGGCFFQSTYLYSWMYARQCYSSTISIKINM